jgi:seryl-tRNA synthetase
MAASLSMKWKIEDVGCARLRSIVRELSAVCAADDSKVREKEAELADLRRKKLKRELGLAQKCAQKKAANAQKFAVIKGAIRRLNAQRSALRKALVFCEKECEKVRRELERIVSEDWSFGDEVDLVGVDGEDRELAEEKRQLRQQVNLLTADFKEAVQESNVKQAVLEKQIEALEAAYAESQMESRRLETDGGGAGIDGEDA